MKQGALCLVVFLLAVLRAGQLEARFLSHCDAVRELEKGNVERTFISNWVCLMQSESNMNTQLVTGPKTASSYSYGIFQISSFNSTWCARGRSAGECNKRCEDFANDDIQDDIVCALKIFGKRGWNYWSGWVKKCKKQKLPDIGKCKRR